MCTVWKFLGVTSSHSRNVTFSNETRWKKVRLFLSHYWVCPPGFPTVWNQSIRRSGCISVTSCILDPSIRISVCLGQEISNSSMYQAHRYPPNFQITVLVFYLPDNSPPLFQCGCLAWWLCSFLVVLLRHHNLSCSGCLRLPFPP